MGGEEAERMAGIHDESLFVGHLAQIFHCEQILSPVLENSAVAAIDNQLMRMLGTYRCGRSGAARRRTQERVRHAALPGNTEGNSGEQDVPVPV